MSKWNGAGTMEERDFSSWAHIRVKELFTNLDISDTAKKLSATTVEGDASIIFTRGKKRPGFELTITFEEVDGPSSDAKIVLKEFTSQALVDEEKLPLTFGKKVSEDVKASLSSGAGKGIVVNTLKTFFEELSAKLD
eukprot:PhF_6_TR11167/c0_g1_i2/m.18002